MNSSLSESAKMLDRIKTETGASFVSVTVSAIGLSVQVGWSDNCHVRRVFSDEEIQQAQFDIVEFVVYYVNKEHDKLVGAK